MIHPEDPEPQQASAADGANTHRRLSMNSSSFDIPRGAIRRTYSMSSTTSDVSAVSSSNPSTANPTPRSRVTPLYNLTFHTLLPTTITDAGTDQRVAKISKKGYIELDGFGQLEPRELVLGVNDLATLHRAAMSAPVGSATHVQNLAAPGAAEGDLRPPVRANTIETNASSLSAGAMTTSESAVSSAYHVSGIDAAHTSGMLVPGQDPPTSFEAMTPSAKSGDDGTNSSSGAGAIGGKFLRSIKRLSLGGAPMRSSPQQASFPSIKSTSKPLPGTPTPTANAFATNIRASFDAAAESVTRRNSIFSSNSSSAVAAVPDVPQMTPVERKPGQKRAEGYIWTIRKWTRKVQEERESLEQQQGRPQSAGNGSRRAEPTESAAAHQLDGMGAGQNDILTRVWRKFNLVNRLGGSEIHPVVNSIPIRFEWTHDTRKVHRRRATEEARAAAQAGIVPGITRAASSSRTSLHSNKGGDTTASQSRKMLKPSSRPTSTHGPPESPLGGKSIDLGSVSGSSIAPEDDAHAEGRATEEDEAESDPEDSETPWTCHLVLGPQTKIPIGTLVPSPHHKRLFGQLAIPFPLPDLSTSGLGIDGAGLTREELKDVITVTALHLVVRENFGNIANKKK